MAKLMVEVAGDGEWCGCCVWSEDNDTKDGLILGGYCGLFNVPKYSGERCRLCLTAEEKIGKLVRGKSGIEKG